jgi:N-acetylneuraminic acid mutarotase
MIHAVLRAVGLIVVLVCLPDGRLAAQSQAAGGKLRWQGLPPLPDELGVAGPFVGVHRDALIVAGGANFPKPVWDHDKQWLDSIHVLIREPQRGYRWIDGGRLPRPVAYGSVVSTPDGVVCIGGNDADDTFTDVFLLALDRQSESVSVTKLPSLPEPRVYAAAAMVGSRIYLIGGQFGAGLETATGDVWSLDWSARGLDSTSERSFAWQRHRPMPGPNRAFHGVAAQHNGQHDAIYVISGRRQAGTQTEFLKDTWEYVPDGETWQRKRDLPRCVMAAPVIACGKRRILVCGGADGSLFHQSDQLRDQHPGFPKQAFCYDVVADQWFDSGPLPANQVTTPATHWDGAIVVASGEIRPRVRTPAVWRIRIAPHLMDSHAPDRQP